MDYLVVHSQTKASRYRNRTSMAVSTTTPTIKLSCSTVTLLTAVKTSMLKRCSKTRQRKQTTSREYLINRQLQQASATLRCSFYPTPANGRSPTKTARSMKKPDGTAGMIL